MKTRISLIIILLLVYVCCSSLKAQNKSSYDDDGYLRIETEQDLKDFANSSDLINNAEGKVQIIDMMGRVICSSDVESDNNRINVNDFDRAAYIVRIIGEDDVKVQKIVL